MAKKVAKKAAAPKAAPPKKVLSEKTKEKHFRDWCKKQGWRCVKLQDVGQEGHPDRTIMFGNSKQVYVELKKLATSKVRPSQLNYINHNLLPNGERVLITHDVEEAKEWILRQFAEMKFGISLPTNTNSPPGTSSSPAQS